jgi:hypothetical protein
MNGSGNGYRVTAADRNGGGRREREGGVNWLDPRYDDPEREGATVGYAEWLEAARAGEAVTVEDGCDAFRAVYAAEVAGAITQKEGRALQYEVRTYLRQLEAK